MNPILHPVVALSLSVLFLACSGGQAEIQTQVGVEIPPEAGAETGANKPIGSVEVSDAEMKAAKRRAKKASAVKAGPKPGSGHKNAASKEAPPDKDDEIYDDPAPPPEKAAVNEPPIDPNPPKDVPTPVDVALPPLDALTAASGLRSKVLQPGTGEAHPGEDDTVVVHYSGWTTDGKRFDSSVTRGQALRIPLKSVVEGFREGVMLMVVGEKRRLWIPQNLAYKGQKGAPAGTLVFDLELLGIQ